MNSVYWIRSMVALVAVTSSFTSALAQQARCNDDMLGNQAAMARLEWARRCGLLKNDPTNKPTQRVTKQINGVEATDYKESLASPFQGASNVYTLPTHDYEVNTQYFSSICTSTAKPNKKPGDGPLSSFELWYCPPKQYKWLVRSKPSAQYPSYGSVKDATGGIQLFPHPDLVDCQLYTDREGKTPVNPVVFYPNLNCQSLDTCNTATPPSPPNYVTPPPQAVPATLMPAPPALCAGDALQSNQVQARLDWARACSLMKNVTSPAAGSDTGVPASNGGTLWDYHETAPQGLNAYWGNIQDSQINSSYVFALFNNGPTSQAIQACGAANGYKSWSRPDTFNGRKLRRAQPMYPVYGSKPSPSSPGFQQLFPSQAAASCDLYEDKQGTKKANAFYVVGYCMSPLP